ncbi:adenylate cyclase [Shimia isoporae]|uniref:Adenylate cyclase n=1 Tax=Shimia isoporae TaxID=647720 RepID=A0A4R1NPT0_9RHOB|nr:adenylate/guanylate cyclase domain-containing protein [Shimia isoporae]TCL08663.1 adenylate cyclase [Shimia isoporae]
MPSDIQRKLTTILAADAAGYSRVMEHNEEEGLRALKAARAVFKKFIARHHGRVANTAGDGLIADFPSVVEAVQCAIEVQRELGALPADPDLALHFRIGIHLGDVMIDGDDLLGEGVNLAARLQSMAEPGGILISRQVYDQVHGKLSVSFQDLGEKHPRNFSEGVQVYGISTLGTAGPAVHLKEPERPSHTNPEPAPRAPTHHPTPDNSASAKEIILQRIKPLGIAILGLCLIDAFSGRGIWAHYPALVLATLAGLHAAPLLATSRWNPLQIRGMIMAGFLVLMNLFTWNGTFWAIWPVGAMVLFEVMRRSTRRS